MSLSPIRKRVTDPNNATNAQKSREHLQAKLDNLKIAPNKLEFKLPNSNYGESENKR